MTEADVLVVTALLEEFEATREVATAGSAGHPGVARWEEQDDDPPPYLLGEYRLAGGNSLLIALARPIEVGGTAAGAVAGVLAERLRPRCLAMSGVCAGNPDEALLGDVIFASLTYRYQEGSRTSAGFHPDHRQTPAPESWIRAAQELRLDGFDTYGPATLAESRRWFLERLLAGEDPRAHHGRSRFVDAGQWEAVLDGLESDGLIATRVDQPELTDAGREFIRWMLYRDVSSPVKLPYRVVVGPIASGDVVVKDGLTWEQLRAQGVARVAGLEMEAATIARTARAREGQQWIVVKGVMDHADPRKDDRFKPFAARASAEVMFGLLARQLMPRSPVPRQTTATRAEVSMPQRGQHPGGVRLGDDKAQSLGADSPQPWPAPRQLPPDVSHFTGRRMDLARLDDLLEQASSDHSTTMVISAVAGAAGVGKTTLAVHWAHQVRDRFPDGDLYANLRGYDPGPAASSAQVIDGFLRAFDIAPERIPAGADAQTALFRSLLHDRQVLVLLDNAASAEQVRPLLPDSPGSLVLVTSRSNLSGLVARDGARRITLDMLTRVEAVELLGKIIGRERADREPQAIAMIAERCVCLPLALRIAAELAVARPHTPLVDIAAELNVEHERLDALAVFDDETAAIRSVFSWSYCTLPARDARAFRLLGLHAGADFSIAAAAALIGRSLAETRRALAALTNTNLLSETASGRYRFHDLLRDYAAERASQDEAEADSAAAVSRSLAWYLNTARSAGRVLNRSRLTTTGSAAAERLPGPAFTHGEALAWFSAELDNLVAATRQAAKLAKHATATDLASVTRAYFQLSMSFDAWTAMATIGLQASRQAGDSNGEANMLGNLAAIANYTGRPEECVDYWEQVVAIRRGRLEGRDLVGLANAYASFPERRDEAIELLTQARILAEQTSAHDVLGHALEGLAAVCYDNGDFEAAAEHAQQAITVFRDAGLSYGLSIALGRLAEACVELNLPHDAIRHGHEALMIRGELGDRRGQAWSHATIAAAFSSIGQRSTADQHWHDALELFEAFGPASAAAWVRTQISSSAADPLV